MFSIPEVATLGPGHAGPYLDWLKLAVLKGNVILIPHQVMTEGWGEGVG